MKRKLLILLSQFLYKIHPIMKGDDLHEPFNPIIRLVHKIDNYLK